MLGLFLRLAASSAICLFFASPVSIRTWTVRHAGELRTIGKQTAAECFLYCSILTSWPVSDLITPRFGVKVVAFELRRERPPPGVVDVAGVEGGDEETLLRLVVCI